VGALIVMVILGISTTSVLTLSSNDMAVSGDFRESIKSFAVGNAGIVFARNKLDWGEDPVIANKTFSDGIFNITTDPTQSLVNVSSDVNGAQKTQILNVDFAKNCTELTHTDLTYSVNEKAMYGFKIKKNCNQKAIIDKISMTWNRNLTAREIDCEGAAYPCLATAAQEAELATISFDYGSWEIKKMVYEGQVVFQAGGGTPNVAHDQDVELSPDASLSDSNYHIFDVHFSSSTTDGSWYWLTVKYKDNSEVDFGPFKVNTL